MINIKKNIKISNSKVFPSDFFGKKKENNSFKFTKDSQIKIIDLQKEYDEDKEILDLLNGKSKSK